MKGKVSLVGTNNHRSVLFYSANEEVEGAKRRSSASKIYIW